MPEYDPPINSHYCHVKVDTLEDEDILKMMGKSGKFFKYVTRVCGARYIWWNQEKKVIEIWGSYECMGKTYNMISNQVDKLKVKFIDNSNE